MHTGGRLHHMDNLRALAMLAGVVFHAALAYSPLAHPVWPAADAGESVIVDVFAWFLHMFRMPLFFVVAGYFSASMTARRGLAGLFRNRCARVLLPLVLFAPPVLAGMGWLTRLAAETTAQPSPALSWIRAYIDQHGDMPPTTGWAHLWFLFYLMLFTVMVWVASALELGRIAGRFAALPTAIVLTGWPLLLALPLALVGTPWPAPEFFVPSLWALAYFGLYFAFGYQLFSRGDLLDRLQPFASCLLLGAIAAYVALFQLTGGFTPMRPSAMQHGVNAVLEGYAGFWSTLWCLLAAKRWLDMRNAIMRWLADGAYWVYLVHLPLLLAIQYELLDMRLHWTAKFAISVAVTLLLSFASYQGLVRHTVIGALLNGTTRGARAGPAATDAV